MAKRYYSEEDRLSQFVAFVRGHRQITMNDLAYLFREHYGFQSLHVWLDASRRARLAQMGVRRERAINPRGVSEFVWYMSPVQKSRSHRLVGAF